MTWIAGLDIGSAFSKAVILKDEELRSHCIRETKGKFAPVAEAVLKGALADAGLTIDRLDLIGGGGLGADFIPYPFEKMTDISCHSRGAHYLFPSVRTLMEIGNQVSRVTKVTPDGKVAGNVTGDKCAAGTGRFLEVIAKVLCVRIEDLGTISLKSKKKVSISSICTVFAQHEVVSRLSEGASLEDIVAGIHDAIASRTARMVATLTVAIDRTGDSILFYLALNGRRPDRLRSHPDPPALHPVCRPR